MFDLKKIKNLNFVFFGERVTDLIINNLNYFYPFFVQQCSIIDNEMSVFVAGLCVKNEKLKLMWVFIQLFLFCCISSLGPTQPVGLDLNSVKKLSFKIPQFSTLLVCIKTIMMRFNEVHNASLLPLLMSRSPSIRGRRWKGSHIFIRLPPRQPFDTVRSFSKSYHPDNWSVQRSRRRHLVVQCSYYSWISRRKRQQRTNFSLSFYRHFNEADAVLHAEAGAESMKPGWPGIGYSRWSLLMPFWFATRPQVFAAASEDHVTQLIQMKLL